jgi:hypothetical protein
MAKDALCRERPGVNFFPPRGEPAAPAKAVCRQCLVREECLKAAPAEPETAGVWGGTSRLERRALAPAFFDDARAVSHANRVAGQRARREREAELDAAEVCAHRA